MFPRASCVFFRSFRCRCRIVVVISNIYLLERNPLLNFAVELFCSRFLAGCEDVF